MAKPNIVVSKCLGFAKCRWNGITIPDKLVEKLRKHVNFIPVCPEVEIGLGIPRDPIRIVKGRLIQPKTKTDYTGKMNRFSEKFLSSLKNIDGFILKAKSPSCGLNVQHRPGKGPGIFAQKVLEKFPDTAIETEKRLTNYKIREKFITKLFALARYRSVKKIKDLIEFHTRNRYLLMSHNQKKTNEMGKIVGEATKKTEKKAIKEYKKHLVKAFEKNPRYTSNINVLMHAYNHFSDKISTREKKYFHKLVKEYRDAQIPLSTVKAVIQDWIYRFDEKYLAKQTFFKPYPEDLIDITDSGKGRNK